MGFAWRQPACDADRIRFASRRDKSATWKSPCGVAGEKPSKASKRPWTRARGSAEAVSTRAKHFNSLALDAFNLRRLLDTPAEARAKRHRSTHHFLQPLLTFIPAPVATFQRRGGDSARCAEPHQGGAPPGLPRRAGRSATPVEGVFGSSLSSLTVGACL